MDEIASQPRQPRTAICGGLTITLLPRGAYRARYTPDKPVAGFTFEAQRGVHAFASDRVRAFYAPANAIAFTPQGCPIYSESAQGGEYLTLSGDSGVLSGFVGSETDGLPRERYTGRVHENGIRTARALRRLLLAGCADPAAIETAAAAFLGAAAEAGGTWRRPAKAASLTLRRLHIVEALIEARLTGPLGVSDMAEACGLSTGFFIRAFKAATGETPHRTLMGRRVAAARRLMHDPRLSAAEIALRTGFCSQAHMTVAFKASIGLTPGAYRAAIAPG